MLMVGRDFFFSFWNSSNGSSGGLDKYFCLPSSFSRFEVGLVLFISRARLWGNERKLRWRQAIATGENTRKKPPV